MTQFPPPPQRERDRSIEERDSGSRGEGKVYRAETAAEFSQEVHMTFAFYEREMTWQKCRKNIGSINSIFKARVTVESST